MATGPLDRDTPLAPSQLQVGIVGTQETVEGVRSWLDKCRSEIPAKESRLTNLFPRFPGFNPEGCFHATVQLHDRWTAPIHARDIAAAKDHPLKAASDAADLFLDHAKRILDQGGPRVLICAPPADLLDTLDSPGQRRDSPEAELDEGSEAPSPAPADRPAFHDLLKARGMALGIPLQMVRPGTYIGRST